MAWASSSLGHRHRELLAWAVRHSLRCGRSHTCIAVLVLVCLFCHSAVSYSSMLTSLLHVGISVKSCPLVFSVFPFSTSLFFFPWSFSLSLLSAFSMWLESGSNCAGKAVGRSSLCATTAHPSQPEITMWELFDHTPSSALKGLPFLATYLASNGNFTNAPVFNFHNFSKRVYSAFRIVDLQTDFCKPAPV